MTTQELLIEILQKAGDRGYLDVAIDAGIPIPFEKRYDIIVDKGFLLFREVSP